MSKQGYVYILAKYRNGTLYIGVTSDISKRVFDHKNKTAKGFSSKYGVGHLVYCESHNDMITAIAREKAMKKWNRAWKIRLIEESNPEWKDLYSTCL